MFCCLDVELSEGFFGQLEGGEVQVMGFLQEALFCLFIMAINGNLLQDQGYGRGVTHTHSESRAI